MSVVGTLVWRAHELDTAPGPCVSSGRPALDAQLPGGGWPQQALTELLLPSWGVGELSLVLPALVSQARAGQSVMWMAPPALPYAPALLQAGLPLEQMVLVQPHRERDVGWALEQTLRSGAMGVVLAWLPEVRRLASGEQLRRLQVAAASSSTLCFLFRPLSARSHPSAAPLRIALAAAAPQRLALTIFKRRGPPQAAAMVLDTSPDAAANDAC